MGSSAGVNVPATLVINKVNLFRDHGHEVVFILVLELLLNDAGCRLLLLDSAVFGKVANFSTLVAFAFKLLCRLLSLPLVLLIKMIWMRGFVGGTASLQQVGFDIKGVKTLSLLIALAHVGFDARFHDQVFKHHLLSLVLEIVLEVLLTRRKFLDEYAPYKVVGQAHPFSHESVDDHLELFNLFHDRLSIDHLVVHKLGHYNMFSTGSIVDSVLPF